jgi:hypothetical protein
MYFTTDDAFYNTTADNITLPEWIGKLVNAGDEPARVPAQF